MVSSLGTAYEQRGRGAALGVAFNVTGGSNIKNFKTGHKNAESARKALRERY